jgi:hypothetical protein
MNCYKNLPACTSTLRAGSDLNRDGQVNGVDYNLWLIEISLGPGYDKLNINLIEF